MNELPQPGQTWYSRDGRVAQVVDSTNDGDWILVEYSDGEKPDALLYRDGRYFGWPGDTINDLVRRSPWDAVRADLPSLSSVLADDIWDDAFWGIYRLIPGRGSSLAREADSEALEFIAWAELRGLTPDNIAEMRGKVAA